MRIPEPTKTLDFKGLIIKPKNNKNVKYLYNHTFRIVKDNKIPAVFGTDKIELPTVTNTIKKALQELKILFEEIK